MRKKRSRLHIGWRTLKTTAAIILSMIIVDFFGATSSKLIFAMLGAMAAVQPTFKESLEACIAQIVGVVFGGVVGVLLLALDLPSLVATGIGIILVITLYNALRITYSPVNASFIVVLLCTTPDIQPITYALGRIWDTAIGLGVGMLINTLIFPYDNSRMIHDTVESLEKEVIHFLEALFDGDDVVPDTDKAMRKIGDMQRQLKIFENQRLVRHLKQQNLKIEEFRICEGKARELLARMVVLSEVKKPGRLNEKNRARLRELGADIRDQRVLDNPTDLDVVTNYHVTQILRLRRDLMAALGREERINSGETEAVEAEE
ncbi:MAG: FUSC family protein [Oscillospiraceae bacterium]|nr:FUSC family protein [Oscillospiraceae bacterium]